jgi:hypothetical protein
MEVFVIFLVSRGVHWNHVVRRRRDMEGSWSLRMNRESKRVK